MLREQDKDLLRSWGHDDQDFEQIEKVMAKRYTKYSLEGSPITREKAVDVLGWRAYLSGIARSAFHATAARQTTDGKTVLFDSSAFFKEAT